MADTNKFRLDTRLLTYETGGLLAVETSAFINLVTAGKSMEGTPFLDALLRTGRTVVISEAVRDELFVRNPTAYQ